MSLIINNFYKIPYISNNLWQFKNMNERNMVAGMLQEIKGETCQEQFFI